MFPEIFAGCAPARFSPQLLDETGCGRMVTGLAQHAMESRVEADQLGRAGAAYRRVRLARPGSVREWGLVDASLDRRKANMAGKDKGGRSSKTPAAKTAKEKRQAKRDKKTGESTTGLVP